MKKSTRNVLIIIMAFISVVALFISMDKVNMENVSTNSHAARIIINFYKSLPNLNISHFFIFIFIKKTIHLFRKLQFLIINKPHLKMMNIIRIILNIKI